MPPGGCGMCSSMHSAFHFSRSSARSIDARRRAGDELHGQQPGELQRRLPAERDDHLRRHATGGDRLRLDHVEHVLARQRLEVQAVAGVVVGAHRLRVAVDHHRLEPGVAQGERGVHAAVVELDALADAVRAAAEDDDPWPVRRARPRCRPPTSSSGTASRRRTRRRRCRRSCTSASPRRPHGWPAPTARRRPTSTPAGHR